MSDKHGKRPKSTTVHIVQRFGAPPETVFGALVDPDMLQRWLIGPAGRDDDGITVDVEARIGGRYAFIVKRDDATVTTCGDYVTYDPPHRLGFTWRVIDEAAETDGGESSVTIALAERSIGPARGCELTLAHTLPPSLAKHAGRIEKRWIESLGLLAELLA